MKLQEKYKKATSEWFDTYECEKIAQDFAIGFTLWISENMYENYWSIEKYDDGLKENSETISKTWISCNDVLELGEDKAICYSIEDLLIMYKFENKL